jgi:hypothetical protein
MSSPESRTQERRAIRRRKVAMLEGRAMFVFIDAPIRDQQRPTEASNEYLFLLARDCIELL